MFVHVWTSLQFWFATHPFVMVLLLSMVFDVVTGVMLAARDGKIVSSIARDGLWRKAGMLIALMLVEALTLSLLRSNDRLPYSSETLAAFMLLPEFFSVVENLGALGVPLPPGFSNLFAHLNGTLPAGKAQAKVEAKLAQEDFRG